MADKTKILVMLEFDPNKIVGIGMVDTEGNLVIHIPASLLTEKFEALTTLNQINGLSLGVSYIPAERKD